MLQSRKFYYIAFVVGALYVLLIQQFFKNEARFILHSPTYTNESPYSFKTNFQELNIPINQDVSLHGIWFKHDTSKAIILLFPYSDEDLRQLKMDESYYYSSGFDVLITAYRSTALSTGKLESENDLFSDAQYWYGFAKSQFPENQIIIAGQGFGASIAAQLAGNKQADALILEAPHFAFGAYSAKSSFWFLPYNYFTAFPLKTWEYVRKTQCKVILIQDEKTMKDVEKLNAYLKTGDEIFVMDTSETLPLAFNLKLKKMLIQLNVSISPN